MAAHLRLLAHGPAVGKAVVELALRGGARPEKDRDLDQGEAARCCHATEQRHV